MRWCRGTLNVGLQAAGRSPYQRYLPKVGGWGTSQDNNVHCEPHEVVALTHGEVFEQRTVP
jgi:hypothetical protein